MTPKPASERTPMYVGYLDPDRRERHISLVPHMPGLEAICGQPVRTTRPGPWRAVVTTATCPTCRTRGVEAARQMLAGNAPPQPPSTTTTTTFLGPVQPQVPTRSGFDRR